MLAQAPEVGYGKELSTRHIHCCTCQHTQRKRGVELGQKQFIQLLRVLNAVMYKATNACQPSQLMESRVDGSLHPMHQRFYMALTQQQLQHSKAACTCICNGTAKAVS